MYHKTLGNITLVKPWQTVIVVSKKCNQAVALVVINSKNSIYGFNCLEFYTSDIELIKDKILLAGLPGEFVIVDIDDGSQPCFVSGLEDICAGILIYKDKTKLSPVIRKEIVKLRPFFNNKNKNLEEYELELGR